MLRELHESPLRKAGASQKEGMSSEVGFWMVTTRMALAKGEEVVVGCKRRRERRPNIGKWLEDDDEEEEGTFLLQKAIFPSATFLVFYFSFSWANNMDVKRAGEF